MPFGLTNAPASFLRTLNILLSGFNWRTHFINLDGVTVFSKSFKVHSKDLDMVLIMFSEAGANLNFNGCCFLTYSVKNLGYIIKPGVLTSTKHAL